MRFNLSKLGPVAAIALPLLGIPSASAQNILNSPLPGADNLDYKNAKAECFGRELGLAKWGPVTTYSVSVAIDHSQMYVAQVDQGGHFINNNVTVGKNGALNIYSSAETETEESPTGSYSAGVVAEIKYIKNGDPRSVAFFKLLEDGRPYISPAKWSKMLSGRRTANR